MESTVNQRLLTEFTADFPNPIIITSMNNNKTWEYTHLLKTFPILIPIRKPIRSPSQMPHGKITKNPT